MTEAHNTPEDVHLADDEPADAVEELMGRCLAATESEWSSVLESACREHPDLADELRSRLQLLRALGIPVPEAEPEDGIPDQLGDFRLLRRLGSGGMGVVYLARQESLNRSVAVKIIRPDLVFFPGTRQRFHREVEAISRLRHPGIVPVHMVGEERGIPYFAMEWLVGCTLSDVLQDLSGRSPQELTGDDLASSVARCTQSNLQEEVATPRQLLFQGTWVQCCLRIVASVTATLEYAHQQGVLHRDVKPSNILLTLDGRAMLLDFGVASTQGVGRLTKTGSQVGSLPYMSPEQILEQTEGLDARTDVYALGVTLYEMLTLRLPFLAQGVEATRRSILEGRCRPPHELNSAVAWDVETVCLKALDHERDARYDTAQAFADDLGRVLTLRPIAARRPGPALRTRRWLQRNPLRAAVVALAFLLIVVAPSIVAWMARQQRDALAIAENDARTQAEAATRIADFMIGIFGDVDPFGEAPVDLTVRAALDRALPRLREDLADQPQIQARLLHEVGQIYVNLGLADDAKELIDQALELYRTHLPDDEKQIAEILLDQGWVLTKQGQFQRALTVLEEARQIATRRQWLAPAAVESAGLSPEVLLTFRSELHARLGDALFNLRRYEDAENSLLQAIEAAEAAPVPIRGRDLSYVMMGTLCLDTDRTSEGVHWLEKALHYQREQHPGGSFNEARVQGRLAFLLWRNDRFPEAEQHFDEARAMSLKLVSGPHPTVAEILHNQASMYYEWRQLARAEQAFREALDIHLEIQGPQGPSTLLCQMALATTLLDLGEVEEAMELAEKNRDILCSPREHHFMAAPTNHLHFGQCLLAQHQYRDAEVELKKAREALIQAGSGPGHAIVEFHLGRLFQELGQPETALQHFERSRDRTRQHRPDDNWQVSRAIGAIGECLQELGQPDEAETKMLEAHHLLERTVGLAAPETVYLSQALAQLYEDQDRLEDAETYWDLFDTGRDSLGVDPR